MIFFYIHILKKKHQIRIHSLRCFIFEFQFSSCGIIIRRFRSSRRYISRSVKFLLISHCVYGLFHSPSWCLSQPTMLYCPREQNDEYWVGWYKYCYFRHNKKMMIILIDVISWFVPADDGDEPFSQSFNFTKRGLKKSSLLRLFRSARESILPQRVKRAFWTSRNEWTWHEWEPKTAVWSKAVTWEKYTNYSNITFRVNGWGPV